MIKQKFVGTGLEVYALATPLHFDTIVNEEAFFILFRFFSFNNLFITHHLTSNYNKLYNNRAAKKGGKNSKRKKQTNKQKQAKYETSTDNNGL